MLIIVAYVNLVYNRHLEVFDVMMSLVIILRYQAQKSCIYIHMCVQTDTTALNPITMPKLRVTRFTSTL